MPTVKLKTIHVRHKENEQKSYGVSNFVVRASWVSMKKISESCGGTKSQK